MTALQEKELVESVQEIARQLATIAAYLARIAQK
jgi:hypothetical protein